MIDTENQAQPPALPDVPDGIDPGIADFLNSLKELIDVQQGRAVNANGLDKVVTMRDLFEAGVINVALDDQILSYENEAGSGDSGIVANGEGQGVYGRPTVPTGLTVVATAFNFIIEFDQPDYNGHWRTEIWVSESQDIGQAFRADTTRTLIYGYELGLTSETRYFWIRHVNRAGKEGDFNAGAAEGVIATTGLVNNTDINTVSADKIVAATLSAIVANLGSITAGFMQSPDGTMTIDLNAKEIVIAGPSGKASDDYMLLTGGLISFYKYVSGTHYLYKTLKHRENGTADSGDTVQIPGYFDSQPTITLSPRNIQVYDSGNSGQDQSLELIAENINEYASGQWEFDAIARLILSDNAGNTVLNITSGSQSSDTYTTAMQTTPASTTAFTVNTRLTSLRGTGTDPDYYNRTVDWRVGYRDNAVGGAYTYTSYNTKAIGDALTAVTDSIVITGLTAKAYDFIVEYISSDVSGPTTFTSGSPSYTYSEETLTGAPGVNIAATTARHNGPGDTDVLPKTTTGSYTMPASVVNTSWEIYEMNWSWEHIFTTSSNPSPPYQYTSYGITSGNDASPSAIVPGHAESHANIGLYNVYSYQTHTETISGNNLTYNPDFITGTTTISNYGSSFLSVYAGWVTREQEVTIKRRDSGTNSLTADNTFELLDYDYTLTGATELSTGSLNWAAIGE